MMVVADATLDRSRVTELHDEGEVERLAARGVLVRLDSGSEVRAEPGLLVVLC